MVVASCASSQTDYTTIVRTPTPQTWLQESSWQFHVLDVDGEWIGSIDLALYATSTDTCTSGDWKDAEVLHSTADAIGIGSAVAYEINGAHIWIDLHANICDSNTMMRGRLFETGAMGTVEYSSPWKGAGHDIGTFTAAPLIQAE